MVQGSHEAPDICTRATISCSTYLHRDPPVSTKGLPGLSCVASTWLMASARFASCVQRGKPSSGGNPEALAREAATVNRLQAGSRAVPAAEEARGASPPQPSALAVCLLLHLAEQSLFQMETLKQNDASVTQDHHVRRGSRTGSSWVAAGRRASLRAQGAGTLEHEAVTRTLCPSRQSLLRPLRRRK